MAVCRIQRVEKRKKIDLLALIYQERRHFVHDKAAERMPAEPIGTALLQLTDLADVNFSELLDSRKLLAGFQFGQTEYVDGLILWQCYGKIPVIESIAAP